METFKSQQRSLAVYTVIAQADGKDTYLRIGGGQGDAFNATLALDAVPINGRLVVRVCEPPDRSGQRRRHVGAAV
jgi:hypothetical protein